MELSLALLMLIVGGILGIVGLAKGWKTQRMKKWMNVLTVILLVVPILAFSGVLQVSWLTNNLSDVFVVKKLQTITPEKQVIKPEKGGKGVVPELCGVEDTTITLSAVDKYTSSAVGGNHRYRVNGAPAKVVSDGGTFTASPGDVIEVLWYNGSTTGYFSKTDTFTVPCAGTKTLYTNLVKNGTLTVKVWNTNGDLIDGSTNQSLSAGDVKTLEGQVEGQYQREFPYGFVVVIEYNKTTMDDVVLTDSSGNEYPSASVPQSHSPIYGTDSARKAYDFPSVVSNELKKISIVLDADDNNDPLVSSSDVILTFYPKNYYINEDKGGAFEGPSAEDEDNVLTRSGYITYTLYIQ